MPQKTDLFIDTSGWAYYLDRSDPLHPKVVTIVQGAVLQRRHLVTTNYILTELVALLSSRFHLPRKEVIEAINALKSDAAVEMSILMRQWTMRLGSYWKHDLTRSGL